MPLIHDETRLASAIEATLTLLRGGLPQAALRRVQALLLDWPDRSGLWHLLATCQTYGGQPAAVRHSLGRALTLNPALAPAWALLARHEETEGCWEAALAALERAGGVSGETFHRLGLRLRNAGRFEAAARAFGRALAVEPDNAGHHFRLGDLLRLLGRREQARVHLRRARDLAPADPAAAHLLAFLDEAGPPAQLPAAMIQALYDARAADWDGLGGSYRGARLVAEAAAVALVGRQGLAVLDLGCGNGACGLILKPLAARLAGIDLSP
ncbi:MAG: tetratricopeptide repeat protein, partial [Rhodospirillales bacterium]|nr:tetratricopeptide repeat protein [Rhodospirillales bacterium]